MAFFRPPGIERLYSGVTNSMASTRGNRVLEVGGDRREAGIVVVVVEGQIAEGNLDHVALWRREADQHVGEFPIDGCLREAADEVPDCEPTHAPTPTGEAYFATVSRTDARIVSPLTLSVPTLNSTISPFLRTRRLDAE